jgi:hypothetical protein
VRESGCRDPGRLGARRSRRGLIAPRDAIGQYHRAKASGAALQFELPAGALARGYLVRFHVDGNTVALFMD